MNSVNKRAGIIIIGDEILSGMVKDTNSSFIIEQLRDIGIEVKRVLVISDVIEEISSAVKEFSDRYDHVFTSGGIGPTHDDVTIEGISRGFNVKMVSAPLLEEHLKSIIGRKPNEVQLRMALIPEGAEIVADSAIGLPLIIFRNIFILPGIPQCLHKKMNIIKRLLQHGRPAYVKRVYVNEYESAIALTLGGITSRNSGIKIGSYPVMDNRDYRVMVAFSAYDEKELEISVQGFLDSLPSEKVVKIEDWSGQDQ